jgi:4-amino-4-deoxy-L-arabinose transferase-like glycosyltransferase
MSDELLNILCQVASGPQRQVMSKIQNANHGSLLPSYWKPLFLAIMVRAVFYAPRLMGDSLRFLGQGQSLASGNGFTLDGKYTLYLSPGYPAFISIFDLFGLGMPRVIGLGQCLLSVLSCWLVYLAVKNRAGERAGLFAFYCLALNPFVARYSWAIMSETLGLFLASVVVWQSSRKAHHQRWQHALSLGALSAMLVLVVPAAVFIVPGIILVTNWKNSHPLRHLAASALGAFLVGMPWSLYLFSVSGSFLPPPVPGVGSGYNQWVQSWSYRAFDVRAYWSTKYIERLPDDVFASEEERRLIIETHRKWRANPHGRNQAQSLEKAGDPRYESVFSEAAERRFRSLSAAQRVVMIGARAVSLWVDYWQWDWFGTSEISPGFAHWPDFARLPFRAIYLAYSLLYLLLIWKAFRSRDAVAWAIVIGIFLYTFSSANFALVEARRNLPFLPFLLFLCASSADTTPRENVKDKEKVR